MPGDVLLGTGSPLVYAPHLGVNLMLPPHDICNAEGTVTVYCLKVMFCVGGRDTDFLVCDARSRGSERRGCE